MRHVLFFWLVYSPQLITVATSQCFRDKYASYMEDLLLWGRYLNRLEILQCSCVKTACVLLQPFFPPFFFLFWKTPEGLSCGFSSEDWPLCSYPCMKVWCRWWLAFWNVLPGPPDKSRWLKAEKTWSLTFGSFIYLFRLKGSCTQKGYWLAG